MLTRPGAVAVVVLAGGQSRRFGADKLAAPVEGERLLDRAVAGLPDDAYMIVVGPEVSGGPAAAMVTGLRTALAGVTAAYYFVRKTINPARGYFINDSGPIYLAPNINDRSRGLHNKIRQSWNLDSVFNKFPATFDRNNLGYPDNSYRAH